MTNNAENAVKAEEMAKKIQEALKAIGIEGEAKVANLGASGHLIGLENELRMVVGNLIEEFGITQDGFEKFVLPLHKRLKDLVIDEIDRYIHSGSEDIIIEAPPLAFLMLAITGVESTRSFVDMDEGLEDECAGCSDKCRAGREQMN